MRDFLVSNLVGANMQEDASRAGVEKLGATQCKVSPGNGSDPCRGSRAQKCCSDHSLCEHVGLFIHALHMHTYIFIPGFLNQT